MNKRFTFSSFRLRAAGTGGKLILLLLLVSLSYQPAPARGQGELEPMDPESVALLAPDGGQGGSVLPNLTTSLSELSSTRSIGRVEGQSAFSALSFDASGERVKVTLVMLDEESARQTIDSLPQLGGEVIYAFQTWIDAWVPVAALEQAAAMPGVSLVHETLPILPVDSPSSLSAPPGVSPASAFLNDRPFYRPQALAVTQGVSASGAPIWHNAGWTGSGVKVAVLDSFKNYQTAIALGELPNRITLYNTSWTQVDTSSTHGTECAEIIYDMAPGVSFTFATPTSPSMMAGLILEMAKTGHKIISSSVGWQGLEPGDGSGVMNNAIRTAYQQYGTLVVQAAGNEALHHWDGLYNDTDGNFWHEFANGQTYIWLNYNQVTKKIDPLPANFNRFGMDLNINLRWNSWPVTSNDYDLYLVRWNGDGQAPSIVKSSTIRQTGNQPPTEFLQYEITQPGYYGIAVQRWSTVGGHVLDVYGHWLPPFSINVPSRSLIDPAASPYALTVGAVHVNNASLEGYSSQGPTKGPGGTLAGGSLKPHISAFAQVDTWAGGAVNFSGTSSATPHVAGAAALVMQAYPTLHPYSIWSHLIGQATDRGPAGVDYGYGYGVLKMWNQPPKNTQTPQTPQNPPGFDCPTCAPPANRVFIPVVQR